MVGPHLTINQ